MSFFENILPTVAGVGLSIAFPELSPWLIGGLVGGEEAIRTGNIGRGFMSGLGAWGGAGLAGALSDVGTQAALANAGGLDAATQTAAQQGTQALNASLPGAQPIPGELGNIYQGANGSVLPQTPEQIAQGVSQGNLTQAQANVYGQGYSSAFPQGGTSAANIGKGLGQVTSSGDAAWDFAKNNYGKLGVVSAPFVADAMSGPKLPPLGSNVDNTPPVDWRKYPANRAEQPDPYKPHGLGYDNMGYAASGGMVRGLARGGRSRHNEWDYDTRQLTPWEAAYKRNGILARNAMMPKGYELQAPDNSRLGIIPTTPVMPSRQPVEALQQKNSGGMLRGLAGGAYLVGQGDGVSDSLYGNIAGQEPVRLARNEFVVPARTVSELGNGSSDAGAEKLYQMIERVEKARKGSMKDYARDTHADRFLPA